jgi:hypothetical protein
LPGDGSGLDSRWFERLTDFQKVETRRQAEFKRTRWPSLADGVYSKRPTYHYPHILPDENLDKSFYPPIFSDVLEYLDEEGIALHTEALNLRSSQVCCFNFLFPLKKDVDKATSILSNALPNLRRVLSIDFEYTGPEGATEWLGEPPGGKRGQNRTSIDAAVRWKDPGNKTRLTFIEWKYTEKALGDCGGYNSPKNDQRHRCETMKVRDIHPARDCYLATKKSNRTSRRYWEHLADAGISLRPLDDHTGCPFIGPFDQLMRQYLLAAYCQAELTNVESVDVIVIGFRGDKDLLRTPEELDHLDHEIVPAWNKLLTTTAPPLRHVFVEDLLSGAPSDDRREYIRERYGV